ncbi:GNAT family N-acetyltransferase [Acaryochloris sp. IP29b_bin.148]|uniref:GNAT family N-acetyltransferase n=1 Tax=Acaryochloris sp. IP29b_bin.148 TaxID=2969218 RepID=UPI0026055D66|nr:GNAT family N-acetyltransferase [Acaryochloris sp. IP29b_bin.148]
MIEKLAPDTPRGIDRMDFQIRPAQHADLAHIRAWAVQESWNPGRYDLEVYWQQNCLLVGWLDQQPIGCISAASYGPEFGFLGCYLVDHRHRGHGYGRFLWDKAISALPAHCIGLEGAVALQETYLRHGFLKSCLHVRHQLLSRPGASKSEALVPIHTLPFKQILAYDTRHSVGMRSHFLRDWLTSPSMQGWGYVQSGELQGYGLIRPAEIGYRIGPLFANTAEVAQQLLSALLQLPPSSQPIFMDVPKINVQAQPLMQMFDAIPLFSNCRMYKGTIPSLPLQEIYGVTTLEMG